MTDNRVTESNLSPRRAFVHLGIALGLSAALVGLFFKGGWGLGLTLAIFAAEAGFWLYSDLLFSKSSISGRHGPSEKGRTLMLIALTAAILALGSTYVLFSNQMLHALNFPIIFYLLVVQSMLLNKTSDRDWDEPLFWLESGLAVMLRPFIKLPNLGQMLKRAFDRNAAAPDDQNQDSAKSANKTSSLFGQILLGLLFAVPVLLIAGSLLASADAVFSRGFSEFVTYWKNLSIKERLTDLALVLILFPFIFSFLESCRTQWQLLSPRTDESSLLKSPTAFSHRERQLKLNPVILISFLASINLLYLVFSIIQLTYLTGAFQASLPAGMSYADYARHGFFELAAISFINVGLIVLAVKGAIRQGMTGRLLRSQSLLLVAGSLIQWFSAMFRMNMYVQAYGQTILRFFVSAFMILIAAVFILLVIKEFKPVFPLFKSVAIAAVISLVLLNIVNPDAWIARHNTQRSITDPTKKFDLNYFRELSPDALVILLDTMPKLDDQTQSLAADNLISRYNDLNNETNGQRWQGFNWSESRAIARIGEVLPSLQELQATLPGK